MFITIQEVTDNIGAIYEDLSVYTLVNIYNILNPLDKIINIGFGLFLKVN